MLACLISVTSVHFNYFFIFTFIKRSRVYLYSSYDEVCLASQYLLLNLSMCREIGIVEFKKKASKENDLSFNFQMWIIGAGIDPNFMSCHPKLLKCLRILFLRRFS